MWPKRVVDAREEFVLTTVLGLLSTACQSAVKAPQRVQTPPGSAPTGELKLHSSRQNFEDHEDMQEEVFCYMH